MPPRRINRLASNQPGSGQSTPSAAKDLAAQPALFAAAAARKSKANKSKLVTPIAKKPKAKKLIDLKSIISPTGAGTPSSSSNKKVSKAVFSLVKAIYQKGEKKGEHSGWIYFRGKPRYGSNEIFKDKVNGVTLEERLRWNDEVKLYTVRVYTYEQAVMVLEHMRMVSELDEKDLKDVEVDEAIFENANATDIKMFPLEVEGEMNEAIAGTTYPFKSVLKEAGFTFHNMVNEQPLNLWLRVMSEDQPEVDFNELETYFEKYGFTVDKYDGVGADEEEDGEEDGEEDEE